MSIFDPTSFIRQHREVPAVCCVCGHTVSLRDRDEATDGALLDSTFLDDYRLELLLLDRASALFARFPDSRHALKVGHEQLQPKLFPRTSCDPDFEAALAADPPLSKFLRRSMFHLPSLRKGVMESIEQLSKRDFSTIRCPVCADGVLRLQIGWLLPAL